MSALPHKRTLRDLNVRKVPIADIPSFTLAGQSSVMRLRRFGGRNEVVGDDADHTRIRAIDIGDKKKCDVTSRE